VVVAEVVQAILAIKYPVEEVEELFLLWYQQLSYLAQKVSL
jgi:hypothetical protein